ncbi:MAG: ATP-binding protein [Butyricimonas faecihominis]
MPRNRHQGSHRYPSCQRAYSASAPVPFREEILTYIEQNQLGYRTDSTNNSLDYVRNKIRHMIIPVCKDINPSFLNTVRENCNTLKEVEQIYRYGIDRLKEEVLSEENGETLIDIQKTLAAPAPYTLYSRSYGPMV